MLKTDIDELQIGDWCFLNRDTDNLYIGLRFLEGDRGFTILPISREENHKNIHGLLCWTWNGDENIPTLNPSILHWGDGHDLPATWHGYLREGKLVTA
jgi:hypothetical protein